MTRHAEPAHSQPGRSQVRNRNQPISARYSGGVNATEEIKIGRNRIESARILVSKQNRPNTNSCCGLEFLSKAKDNEEVTDMDLPLPHAIETYVRAENSGDVDAISECFAPYATVRDADDYYEGRPAIKSWKAKNHDNKLTPLEISTSNGNATLKAQLSGRFPGSPVTANFHFALVDDQIASLQIRC